MGPYLWVLGWCRSLQRHCASKALAPAGGVVPFRCNSDKAGVALIGVRNQDARISVCVNTARPLLASSNIAAPLLYQHVEVLPRCCGGISFVPFKGRVRSRDFQYQGGCRSFLRFDISEGVVI